MPNLKTAPIQLPVDIRLATEEDRGMVAHCVCQAFIHYIPRIGKQPGPMLDDYHALIQSGHVYVADLQGDLAGVVVLLETDEGFCLETIAVRPDAQGHGVGKALLHFAETVARRSGYKSIYLSTHRLMHESQAVYAHIGYVEFDRRIVNGYDRIFVRKQL